MSLDKAIQYGKERRKEYRYSKAIAKSCRNHGGCPWCESNRFHNSLVKIQAMKEKEKDYEQSRDEETT